MPGRVTQSFAGLSTLLTITKVSQVPNLGLHIVSRYVHKYRM